MRVVGVKTLDNRLNECVRLNGHADTAGGRLSAYMQGGLISIYFTFGRPNVYFICMIKRVFWLQQNPCRLGSQVNLLAVRCPPSRQDNYRQYVATCYLRELRSTLKGSPT